MSDIRVFGMPVYEKKISQLLDFQRVNLNLHSLKMLPTKFG